MVKKQKLTELDEDEELINFVEVLDKTEVIKKSLNELKEETTRFSQENSEHETEKIIETTGLHEQKKRRENQSKKKNKQQKSFKRNTNKDKQDPDVVVIHKKLKASFSIDFKSAFFQKLLSYTIILIVVDLIAHFSNAADGVNVFDQANYSSIYLNENMNTTFIKLLMFVMYVYVISPRGNLHLDENGINCMKSAIQSSFFLKTEYYHLPWRDIIYVRQNYRLFESYLCFYDLKDEQIGMVNFCLKSSEKNKFKEFVIENGPSDNAIVAFVKNI
tara:strand:- start:7949 stop:8770 length:822 start_codon:yes stop_codon:yes gene_type:complete